MTTRVGCCTTSADTNSLVSVSAVGPQLPLPHPARGYLVARLADLSGQRSRAQHLRIAHFLHARGDDAEALDHAIASRDRATLFTRSTTAACGSSFRAIARSWSAQSRTCWKACATSNRVGASSTSWRPSGTRCRSLPSRGPPRGGGRPRTVGRTFGGGPVQLDRLAAAAWLYRDRLRGELDPTVVDSVLGRRDGRPLRPSGPGRPPGLRARDGRHRPAAARSVRRRGGGARVDRSSTREVRGHEFVVMTCAAGLSTAQSALGALAEMEQGGVRHRLRHRPGLGSVATTAAGLRLCRQHRTRRARPQRPPSSSTSPRPSSRSGPASPTPRRGRSAWHGAKGRPVAARDPLVRRLRPRRRPTRRAAPHRACSSRGGAAAGVRPLLAAARHAPAGGAPPDGPLLRGDRPGPSDLGPGWPAAGAGGETECWRPSSRCASTASRRRVRSSSG